MKTFLYILIILFVFTSCKKSKYRRQLEREINDTKWEFTHATDANGNDITAQVLSDSAICECFEFYKTEKNGEFNALISECRNTFYSSYKTNWNVYDWVKKERKLKRRGSDASYSNRWADFAFATANMGLENERSYNYLQYQDLILNGDILIDPAYKVRTDGLITDTLLETRYYKKINL